MVASETGGLQF